MAPQSHKHYHVTATSKTNTADISQKLPAPPGDNYPHSPSATAPSNNVFPPHLFPIYQPIPVPNQNYKVYDCIVLDIGSSGITSQDSRAGYDLVEYSGYWL